MQAIDRFKERAARTLGLRRPEPLEAPEALLHRLHFTVMRPLARALGGSEHAWTRTSSAVLEDHRAYQPGDDTRHIDWNITARTEEPYVRQTRAERAVDVWLLFDVSASIDWGTAQRLKRQLGLEFAAVAGTVLTRSGNRLGAMAFAHHPIEVIPPATGKAHLIHVLGRLRDSTRQTHSGATDLAGALRRAGTVLRHKSLIIVVSDFITPADWARELRRLSERHDVVAARLTDPRECSLPDIGMVTLQDPETGAQLRVDTHNPALRDRFSSAANQQSTAIRRSILAAGAQPLILDTAEALLPAVIRFLGARKAARGNGVRGAR